MLSYLDEIPVCAAYRIDRKETRRFPAPLWLDKAQPVCEALPGWACDISRARAFADLPARARRYVNRIEELVGVPVGWISVGPHREAILRRRGDRST